MLLFILYVVGVEVAVDCALIQPPDVKRLCMRYLSHEYEYEYEYESMSMSKSMSMRV